MLELKSREDIPFFVLWLLSVFLWSLDTWSTQTLIWNNGVYMELNPWAKLTYELFDGSASPLFFMVITFSHLLVWAVYKKFRILGFVLIMEGLAVTLFTNWHNLVML